MAMFAVYLVYINVMDTMTVEITAMKYHVPRVSSVHAYIIISYCEFVF